MAGSGQLCLYVVMKLRAVAISHYPPIVACHRLVRGFFVAWQETTL